MSRLDTPKHLSNQLSRSALLAGAWEVIDVATMQVSVLRGVGQVAVEERSVPEPAANEVLVEVGSVGVCGSDVHYFEHGRIGPYVVNSPLVLGHEACGVVPPPPVGRASPCCHPGMGRTGWSPRTPPVPSGCTAAPSPT